MKRCFIYNPHSGRNAGRARLLDRVRAFLAEHDPNAEVAVTTRPCQATEFARSAVARGCETVVAVGGDGTINEVAIALIGTPAVLGLIPCGSGNGLARHLGIPRPNSRAFQTLLDGEIRTIDTGVANEFPFVNAMGLGFDAEVSIRFNDVSRRGLPTYVSTTLAAWRSYEPESITVRTATETRVGPALLLAVGNSDQYGNGCTIAPGARVDDGLLDLTVLPPVGWVGAASVAWRLFTRQLDGTRGVTRLRSPTFTVERSRPGPIHTDGEVQQTGARVEIAVRPRSLRILVPDPAGS